MGVLNKLSRLVIGGTAAARYEATEVLEQCYARCVTQARQLGRHAEMAPQSYSQEALNELASAEATQVERLGEAVRTAGKTPSAVAEVPLPPGASNHWARLVQDLESHRTSFRRLRELAVHFAETLPSTARLFDDWCREEDVHCERLRTLIARADPQALN